MAYVSACQLDAWCGSREPEVAACHSLEAYARRCADLDICLDWRSEDLCPKKCSGGEENDHPKDTEILLFIFANTVYILYVEQHMLFAVM